MSRFNYYLCGLCVNEKTEKEKCFSVPFSFKNEELFEMWADMMFDDMGNSFNTWLWCNGHEKWVLNDIIEPERVIREDEKIKEYVMINE